MKKVIYRKYFLPFCFLTAALSWAIMSKPVYAINNVLEGLSGKCLTDGTCSLREFLLVFVNSGNLILGVSGSAALFMFVIGGVMWVFSGGSEQRVTRGKQLMIGAVVGLAIVFGAWLMVKFIGELLNVKPEYQMSRADKQLESQLSTSVGYYLGEKEV